MEHQGNRFMGGDYNIEGLLKGLSGLLCLVAITCEALLRCAATPLAGFGLFFRVSLRGRHGALLRCVCSLCGGNLPKRT
jgi:hypothetical protein